MESVGATAPKPEAVNPREHSPSPPRLLRYAGTRYSGYLSPALSIPDLLLNEPESATLFPGARILLDCEGRQIVRLPLEVNGETRYCFSYFFRNRSLQRSLRRCYAYRVLRISRQLSFHGLKSLNVLAAVRRNGEILNRHSLIIASEIGDVAELSSMGNHRFHVHPQLEMDTTIAAGLGAAVASWHSQHFFHGDLKTRHILVARGLTTSFSLVDLEKTVYLRGLPPIFNDILAARDLIQLFSSSPSAQESNEVRDALLSAYLVQRGLSPQRVKRLQLFVELYGPHGPFSQGTTLFGNIVSWIRSSLG